MSNTLKVKELDLSYLEPRDLNKDGAIYLVIGQSGAGKTWIMKNILHFKSSFIPVTVAVSETESVNKTFGENVPQLFIHEDAKDLPNIIQKCMDRQAVAIDKGIANPFLTLLLDDCMNKQQNMNDDVSIQMFKTSRHYKMLVVISCQYSCDIRPMSRSQCAGFFILKQDNEKQRKSLFDNFASCIPNQAIFNTLMDTLTTDHCCMYIDNRNTSADWRERVYWYRASDLRDKKFIAASEDVIKCNEERLDKDCSPIQNVLERIAMHNNKRGKRIHSSR